MVLDVISGLAVTLFAINVLFTLIIWGIRLLIWKIKGKSYRKPSFLVTFFAILSIRCVSGLIFSESGLLGALNVIIGVFSFAAAYSLYEKKNKEHEMKTAIVPLMICNATMKNLDTKNSVNDLMTIT